MTLLVPLLLGSFRAKADVAVTDERIKEERLSFQSFAPWSPRTHLNADVAMVYGIDKTLPERLETWRQHGYRVEVMTGASWGEYQDYLYGRFDGINHEDEAQTDRNGNKVGHGRDVYYMSPGEAYGRFLSVGVKRALDAGAQAIYLEEPEFWVRSGYEPHFKSEWKAYYGDEWQPLYSSPDAQYRASKLKYYLYRRALSQVFDFVHQYSQQTGRQIACYVPTHSLINYAHWGIVSPESSLLDVGCDGYIAQVWTGTARTPNVYEGREKERTFETAFLEYGAMQNLARASGRRVWYLNDPVEDNPNHSWTDYRMNWQNTLVASLLQPEVSRYEIMPWPDRIFNGTYPIKDVSQRKPGEAVQKEPIPHDYETVLQSVISALGDMKQPSNAVRWEWSGTRGVGVLVSDTMMFQRGEPTPSDPHLGSFYGLAMPLLKHGVPVEPVQIESATKPGFLQNYRVLLLTYEGQKPPTPEFHRALAQWVRNGGALVIIDTDKDPYNSVHDWWNKAPLAYQTPLQHLLETLGLAQNATGTFPVGKGVVLRAMLSPAAMTYRPDGATQVRALVQQAATAIKMPWQAANALVLRRGPYVVAAGLDESVDGAPSPILHGHFINLFDANLAVLTQVPVTPNQRLLMVDVDAFRDRQPHIIAAACRVRDVKVTRREMSFHTDGIAATQAVICIALPRAPKTVEADGKPVAPADYDYVNGILRLQFPNSPDGISIIIRR
ncbi:MAG: DUF4350 domain-containing protein [Abitibacteriaceae bacterium]|nr:DUF4350 domain-containing protein [Abditibacteriaceae bacterium]